MKSPDKIVNSNMLSFSFDTASVKRSGLNFTGKNGNAPNFDPFMLNMDIITLR